MFASNFGGSLPAVEGEPEGDELLESNILDEDGATKGGWSRAGEEDGFKVYVCACRGVGGRYWRGLGRIDINGEWI